MKKKFATLAIVCALFAAGCSDDDSTSSNRELDEAVTREDSTKGFLYSYDKFKSKKDVMILDEDTTKISVDLEFAQSVDKSLPQKANVVGIWSSIKSEPFYVRVVSSTIDSGRVVLNVTKASPFDVIPEGKYYLSSEIYFNAEKMKENADGELGDSVFFDEKNNTFHPIVIAEEEALEDENYMPLDYEVLSPGGYDDSFEDGVLDLRKALKSNLNWNVDKKIIHLDMRFTPGTIGIPGLSGSYGDYIGSWGSVLFGENKIETMQKAFDKNAGEKVQPGIWGFKKPYIRIDTVEFAKDLDFHFYFETSWGVPTKLEVLEYSKTKIRVSNFGAGLGLNLSGEKKLTNNSGMRLYFSLFGWPVVIKAYVDLYFKYNFDAFALFNYELNYRYTSTDTTGLIWEKGKGLKDVDKIHHDHSFNKPKDFKDFISKSHMVASGKANVGLYGRASFLFYEVGGPTIGIGGRLDLESIIDVGGSRLFDDDGNWTGTADINEKVKMDVALPLEMGGEVRILGKQLFKRAYDVKDLAKWNILNLEASNKD